MAKHTDVVTETIAQGQPIGITEISTVGGIEQVSENIDNNALALELFMNDVLTIIVHHDNQEGQLDIIPPNVNGINQPIIRGVESKVKRKYVEVMTRSRNTNYTQRRSDQSDPASLKMVPNSRVSYPFSVIHDPSPKGRAWLEGITREQ